LGIWAGFGHDAVTKRSPKFRLEFVAKHVHSVMADCQRSKHSVSSLDFGTVRGVPGLDCRKRKTQGYSPELMVAQLLYSLTSGGVRWRMRND